MLTGDDVVNGRVFDDVVAMGGYHVDIHRPDGTWVDSTDTQAYDIPFRSLVASAGLTSPFEPGCLPEVVEAARAAMR